MSLIEKISQFNPQRPYVWELKITEDEFRSLEKDLCSYSPDESNREDALKIIVYLAEWYKRCYQSGSIENKSIDLDSEQLKTLWYALGINIEKYVYRTASGNHLWQYSIYVLGGLAIKHELSKADDRFLKAICRMLHGENYTLENLDDESRAIAFRSSIKEKHSLYDFLSEIVNGKQPYHEDELINPNSDARLLIERIKHANDEVLKQKYRFEWIVNYEPDYDYLQRRLRLWFNPEEVGTGLHHYLRYDRTMLWGVKNPESILRLFISLRFLDGDNVVQDVNFDKPIVSYINTGDANTGFVAHGVNNYGTCHHIPTEHFNKIEIWVKDNEGNTLCIQEQVCTEFMQMWRVSPYDDEWSSRQSAQKMTAVIFSNKCQLKLGESSGMVRTLPFRDKKYGTSADYGWYNIYDNVTIVDEKGEEFTLYNRIGYDQICTRFYSAIAYDETGTVKHISESDDEDFDAEEENIALVFNKEDIIVRHFATKDAIKNAMPESDNAAELIQFKNSAGGFEEWTEANCPRYGAVDLRIFVKGRQLPYKVFYIPAVSEEMPIVRDYQNAQIKYISFRDGNIVETIIQDKIETSDKPIAPTREIIVGSDFDYVVINVYRPTLIREVCRNGNVVQVIDNKDVVLPYCFKDDSVINCFTEEGYQSYRCNGLSSVFSLLSNMQDSHFHAWSNGQLYNAKDLDPYAPECLKVSFGSTQYGNEPVSFYKWNYWKSQEPELCEYSDDTDPNTIVFQSLAEKDMITCVLPTRGKFSPFKYKKQEISVVKCFDVALAHNLYFFILFPLSKIEDYKAELYEPLFVSRGGNLSEEDKKGLCRLAEEFKFDWKEEYNVEI